MNSSLLNRLGVRLAIHFQGPTLPRLACVCLLLLTCIAGPGSTQAGATEGREAPALQSESAAVDFALAKLLAAEGEFDEASVRFDRAVAKDPEEAVLRIEYAEFLFRYRRVDEAKVQIAEARRLAPEEPAALRTFGQIFLSSPQPTSDDVAAAIGSLEALRQEDPSDLMGMVTLAQAYEGSRRASDAADVIGELVGFHNENDRLKRYWVDLLSRAGRQAEATEVLREVVRLEQESIDSRLELADREALEGNFSAAVDLLNQLRQLQGDNVDQDVLRRLAQAYLSRSQSPGLTEEQQAEDLQSAAEVADALDAAEGLGLRARIYALSERGSEAIELITSAPPEQADVSNQVLLAQLLEREARIGDAEQALDRAVALANDEQRLAIEVQRVRFLARHDKWEQVVARAEAVIGDSAVDEYPGLRALRLEALVEQGEFAQAMRILKTEGGRNPTPENVMSRAEVLAAQGKSKEALKELAKIDDSDPGLEQRRAEVLIELNDIDGASEVVENLLGVDTFAALFSAGQFFSRDGLFERAQSYFERAVESSEAKEDDDLRADAHFLLGQAFERQANIDQAAEQFRKVIEIRADDSLALNYLGYMLADADRDLEEALRLIERAVELDPNNGAFRDSLGWAQYRLGDYSAAVESLERATRLSPGNPTIFDHLGDAYSALERTEDALQAYERAIPFADEGQVEALRSKIDRLTGTLGSQ